MVKITVRDLSEATHRVLCLRAARHGHSVAAEVRAVLDACLGQPGSAPRSMSGAPRGRLTQEEFTLFVRAIDRRPFPDASPT